MRLAFVIAFSVAGAAINATQTLAACNGIWSADGQQPHVGDAYTSDAIPSPDKQKTLTISEEAVTFTRGEGKSIVLPIPINTALMEIVWSKSSNGFAINVSDASNEGPWKTFLYKLVPDHEEPMLVAVDVEANQLLATLSRCDAKSPANLATVAWIDAGNEVLIALEPPTTVACRGKGELVAVRVSTTTGKLLERISKLALQESRVSELGCRLQN